MSAAAEYMAPRGHDASGPYLVLFSTADTNPPFAPWAPTAAHAEGQKERPDMLRHDPRS